MKNNIVNRKIKAKGFTLIELLIVIAIIGILATLISANFVGIRQRARDAERKSDLRQLQSALELYKSDVGNYPSGYSNYSVNNSSSCSNATRAAFSLNNITYMSKVPCDPIGAFNNGNYYYYSATGTAYTLAACLENSNDGDMDSTTTAPTPLNSTCSGKYYVLNNP